METEPQLFNPEDFYPYPKIKYEEEVILDNSDAWYGVVYQDHEGAETVNAEIFMNPNGTGTVAVPIIVVHDGLGTTIDSEPSFESLDEDKILWYARQALRHYTLYSTR